MMKEKGKPGAYISQRKKAQDAECKDFVSSLPSDLNSFPRHGRKGKLKLEVRRATWTGLSWKLTGQATGSCLDS